MNQAQIKLVFEIQSLRYSEKLTAIAILHALESDPAVVSYGALARMTGLARKTVTKAVGALEEQRFLRRIQSDAHGFVAVEVLEKAATTARSEHSRRRRWADRGLAHLVDGNERTLCGWDTRHAAWSVAPSDARLCDDCVCAARQQRGEAE